MPAKKQPVKAQTSDREAEHRHSEQPPAATAQQLSPRITLQRMPRGPRAFSPRDMQQLQQTIGNQAVMRLLKNSSPTLISTEASAGVEGHISRNANTSAFLQRAINFSNLMGFISSCEAVGLNIDDRGGDILVWSADGSKEERHIHIFFTFNDEPPHQISTIKPKDFDQDRPNLANEATNNWANSVAHMHQATKNTVALLKKVIDKDGVGY